MLVYKEESMAILWIIVFAFFIGCAYYSGFHDGVYQAQNKEENMNG